MAHLGDVANGTIMSGVVASLQSCPCVSLDDGESARQRERQKTRVLKLSVIYIFPDQCLHLAAMSSYSVHLALVATLKTGGLLGVRTSSLTPMCQMPTGGAI